MPGVPGVSCAHASEGCACAWFSVLLVARDSTNRRHTEGSTSSSKMFFDSCPLHLILGDCQWWTGSLLFHGPFTQYRPSCLHVVKSWHAFRKIVTSMFRTQGPMFRTRGSMARKRGSIARTRGPMVRTRGSMARTRGSMARTRGTMARTRGSMARTRGSMVRTRGPMVRTNQESIDAWPNDIGSWWELLRPGELYNHSAIVSGSMTLDPPVIRQAMGGGGSVKQNFPSPHNV